MSVLEFVAKKWLSDIYWFSRLVVKRPLHDYQLAPARAIVESVLRQRGLEFAVMFPRQSGKNETQSQVEAYLLNLFQRVPGASIVKAQPSLKPQGLNALGRLQRSLRNDWNKGQWRTANGYQVLLGEAMATFFSANPEANTVGATASLLLECDEAQDVLEAEWEKKFIPMAAATNATIVYWGTAWTSRTLLGRVIRRLREQERLDGVRRVFVVTPEQVAQENPAYGEFIQRQVAAKGRMHPLVRTQFFNEEIDAEGGMFPAARQALMQGSHARQERPAWEAGSLKLEAGEAPIPVYDRPASSVPLPIYCLLLDVAGEDEGAVGPDPARGRNSGGAGEPLENPKRDATVLTIVEVDLSTLADPVLAAPTYRAVNRRIWVGVKHATLYGILRATAQTWRARYVVIDATGVGAGLVSFLTKALGSAKESARSGLAAQRSAGLGQSGHGVIAFDFTSASKSKLGWDFLGICDSGRFLEYTAPATGRALSESASGLVGAGAPASDGRGAGARGSGGEASSPLHPFPPAPLLDPESALFWNELSFCQYEVLPGPGQRMRWGVPDGTRDPATGALVHDDTIMSAALCAVLDREAQTWSADTGPGQVLAMPDVIANMDKGF